MSLYTCTCEHCSVWRAALKAQIAVAHSTSLGISPVEFFERLLEIPHVGDLVHDIATDASLNAPDVSSLGEFAAAIEQSVAEWQATDDEEGNEDD